MHAQTRSCPVPRSESFDRMTRARAQAMAGMLGRPPAEIEGMVAELQRSGVDASAALDQIVIDSFS